MAAQTIAFASVLRRTPPHLRVVRHLFMSNSYHDATAVTPRRSFFGRLLKMLSRIHAGHPLIRDIHDDIAKDTKLNNTARSGAFSILSHQPSKLCHYTSTGIHGFGCRFHNPSQPFMNFLSIINLRADAFAARRLACSYRAHL
jgi:hypothetical protein